MVDVDVLKMLMVLPTEEASERARMGTVTSLSRQLLVQVEMPSLFK